MEVVWEHRNILPGSIRSSPKYGIGPPPKRIRISRTWSQDWSDSLKLWVVDNLLLDHVELPPGLFFYYLAGPV